MNDDVRREFSTLTAREPIPLARGALLIAKEEYPSLDIDEYLDKLATLAREAEPIVRAGEDTVERIQLLSHFLFELKGFEGNAENYNDPRNSFLNDVLNRRLGLPITLSVVYLEVGRRLGINLFGVSFPTHFLVKAVDERGELIIDPFNAGAILSLDEIKARLKEKAAAYELVRFDGFAFIFPGVGETLINMTHFETPLTPSGHAEMLLEGRRQCDQLVKFLRNEFPNAFSKATVRSYGLPGIRQTRWIVGGYTLTADDVRTGREFPDTVVRCTWPIEIHDAADEATWEIFGDDHMHYVPLRSLVPPETENLVAVGRCIDADVVALSSVRVMGPCIGMGAAAAHALDLAGDHSLHRIDVPELQRRLKRNLTETT